MGEARYSGGEEGTQMQKVVREFGLAKFVQISPLREGRGWGEWRLAYVNKEGKLSLEEDCTGRQHLLLRFDEPAGYYHTGNGYLREEESRIIFRTRCSTYVVELVTV